MKIGFIGLGQMGTGMATSLLKAGHDVTVYNRTVGKLAKLVDAGAKAASHIGEACQSDVVVTMLADDKAVETLAEGMVAQLRPGAIHISSSTISVQCAERLTQLHNQKGQIFVSAPVFGRPEAAVAAKLFVVAAGPQDALVKCEAVFQAVGQKTFVVSAVPKDANLIKLSGNFLIANVIEALSEAMALIGKAGLDTRQYLDLLTSTLFTAPVYKTYGDLIVAKKFSPPGFAAPLGYKDVRLTLAAADNLQVPMPLVSLLRDRFLALLAQGGETLDWSAISQLSVKDSGQNIS